MPEAELTSPVKAVAVRRSDSVERSFPVHHLQDGLARLDLTVSVVTVMRRGSRQLARFAGRGKRQVIRVTAVCPIQLPGDSGEAPVQISGDKVAQRRACACPLRQCARAHGNVESVARVGDFAPG